MASVSDLPTGSRRRIQLGFPLGWAIDLRPDVAGAPQNGMARAEKYQAWGGHFFVAICSSVESKVVLCGSRARAEFKTRVSATVGGRGRVCGGGREV